MCQNIVKQLQVENEGLRGKINEFDSIQNQKYDMERLQNKVKILEGDLEQAHSKIIQHESKVRVISAAQHSSQMSH